MIQHIIHPIPNSLLSSCLQGTLARSHSNNSLSLSLPSSWIGVNSSEAHTLPNQDI